MNDKINMFIEPILSKKHKHDLFAWLKMRKLIKKLKKTSPDYTMLRDISRFLSLLEMIYLYSNSDNHYLFSATAPTQYSNKFDAAFIYKENDFTIKFVLRDSDRCITITEEKNMRSNKYTNNISFIDGQCEINNEYDKEHFIFIISCLMDGLSELIEYYYKAKRF